jgi:hypothetical protein
MLYHWERFGHNFNEVKMTDTTQPAWQYLLESGSMVEFRVIDSDITLSTDKENVAVQINLVFTSDDEEETDGSETAEWGTFGFIYTLASLSFLDARPRGMSGVDFIENDLFTEKDLFEALSFRHDGIHFHADYVRGRSMKTSISVSSAGRVKIDTWGRGERALRWLDKLKGKKTMELINND